ncbi:MAG: hypothetical protein IJ437_01330 [Clostridia bacterium]|nr:hypothetical protein [Clostridia bacterium]
MKKLIALFILITFVFMLVACGSSYSKDYYEEISSYVNENEGKITHNEKLEYYFYDTIVNTNENTYYGYYYTKSNEIVPCEEDTMDLPKTYTEDDGGYYFGEASDKNDWCFVKKIDNNWYYFETHDYIYG